MKSQTKVSLLATATENSEAADNVSEGGGNNSEKKTKKKSPKLTKTIKPTGQNSCVLLLGTTGAGKTSTLNIFTGNTLATGSDAQSVTDKTTMCPDHIHTTGPSWIDNPGWSDTTGRSDAELFKDLLWFLQDHKIYNILAVIWCVLPQPRMDSTLQNQAKFIDMFTMDNDKGTYFVFENKIAWKKYSLIRMFFSTLRQDLVQCPHYCQGWEKS